MPEKFETYKPEPALVSNFLAIREKPKVNPLVTDFPEDFYDKKSREHSFEEAKNAFEFVFDKKKLLHHLEQKKIRRVLLI